MNINDIRAFVPSKDYELSKSFYVALGFDGESAGEALTIFTKDGCTFFLQKYYNEEFANNVMLQLIVNDINESYELISEIKIENVRHSEIKVEPWGKVIYLWGPSGELWHVTELRS
ncbi:glyoxalase [Marinomonas polaris]|uniref:lactoylglutathione lyase n=1 Tax=Marinomonas TaxID=28253 RepID=UPI000C1F8B66|nr:lactoylglutathione lyase [Marinomonas sp. BSi20584]PJE57247.1 lactoylglutathione lyase [Marinomonas sp. BSi20584]